MKRIIALILAAIMLTGLASCGANTEVDTPEEKVINPDDIALRSENFSMTMAEVAYVFMQNYNDFRYNSSDSYDMYNIDSDKSLKEQEYHDGITWFEYFSDVAVDYLKYILVFLEVAKATDIELDEQDRQDIDETVRSWTLYAENYDYDIDELFAKYFNSDVTLEVFQNYVEKEALALKCYNQLIAGYEFSDEDMTKFVEDNPDSFYCISYIKYTLDEDDDDDAEKHAAELAEIKDAAQFADYIKAHIETYVCSDEDDDADAKLEECYIDYALKSEYSEFSKWAFDGAGLYDTYSEENSVDGEYTVYMLTGLPATQDYNTRNIRYILADTANHESYKKTIDYINDVLDEWKGGEATEESFAELAKEKSEDETTKENGGLLTQLSASDTGYPDGLIKWLFSEERAVDDTTVIKGTQVYIAVYYAGEDEVQWKTTAVRGLTNEAYTADFENLSEKHPVTVNEDVVAGVNA